MVGRRSRSETAWRRGAGWIRALTALAAVAATVAIGLAAPSPAAADAGLAERDARAERLGLDFGDVVALDEARAEKRAAEGEVRSLALHLEKARKNRDAWAALAAWSATGDEAAGAAERRAERLERVRDYDGKIAADEARIAALEEEIAALDARIREIVARAQRDPEPASEAAEETGPEAIGLAIVSGYWREATSDRVVGLFADDITGERTNRIRLFTHDRVWTGTYEDRPASDPERVQKTHIDLRHSPKAAEMNPELPLWVREAIEGELEWRITLDETCCPYELVGAFDPGLVTYPAEGRDESRIAVENGAGTPRPLRYRMAETPRPEKPLPEARIEIMPLGAGLLATIARQSGADGPVTLLEEQPVDIRFMLNGEAYARAGKPARLTATVTNPGSGESATLALRRRAPLLPDAVFYTLEKPVSFGDDTDLSAGRDPGFMTTDWMMEAFGGQPGTRIDLEIGRAADLTVEIAGHTRTLRVHDGMVQLMVERALADLAAREAAWAAADRDRTIGIDDWLRTHHQRQMARNVRTVIGNIREALPEAGRAREGLELAVLQFYLWGSSSIIEISDDASSSASEARSRILGPAERQVNARMLATPEGRYLRGVEWVTSGERALWQVIRDYREAKFDEIALSFAQNASEAAHGYVTDASGIPFDLIYGAVTGQDLMGRPLAPGQFWTMLAQAVPSVVADAVQTTALRRMRDGPRMAGEAAGRPRIRDGVGRTGRQTPRGEGAGPSAAKRQAVREAILAAQPEGRPPSARAAERRVALRGLDGSGPRRRPAGDDVDVGNLDERGGFVPPYRVLLRDAGPEQCSLDCAFYAPTQHVLAKHFDRVGSPEIANLLAAAHGRAPRRGVSWDIETDTIVVLRRFGFAVDEPHRGRFSVEHIRDLMKGADGSGRPSEVGVSVRGGQLSNHFIMVREVVEDADGKPTHVRYLETSTGTGLSEVRVMTAANFLRWMDSRMRGKGSEPHALVVFRPPEGGFTEAQKGRIQKIADADPSNMPPALRRHLDRQNEAYDYARQIRAAEARMAERQRNAERIRARERRAAEDAATNPAQMMRRVFGETPPGPELHAAIRRANDYLAGRREDPAFRRYVAGLPAEDRAFTAAAALRRVGVDLEEAGIIEGLAARHGIDPSKAALEIDLAAAPGTGFVAGE